MWALHITDRLRQLRRSLRLGQQHVAEALKISVSEISRLERGVRGLRVEQLGIWARALGLRAEIVLWEPADPSELSSEEVPHLDEDGLRLLATVAAALPHMPRPARQALAYEMRLWSHDGTDDSAESDLIAS